ncbi:uncharacterized protein PV09_07675 [Verruconis gallopava]|uniref:VanZ-like domain-containing protein n=1 Tax=Verruconis gallopava TaxID=253628 RepID=A0A0D2A3F0_9PEZI|nr:uncharacterized protein PV09_07675 [Verruconis gallopava]KIW00935.1 hypothetical protein PV09_07675 [Verruconis gallopava]
MRIRQYPAFAFAGLLIISAYLGLAPQTIPSYKQSDKVLHFVTFILLTLSFYWIIETSRRRVLHLTLFVCPVTLGIGSEIAQGLLPNGREFDPYDILANLLGCATAIAACTWYHKRMLERKRQARQYSLVSGEADVELGENIGEQESGVTGTHSQTLEEEVDNWDENNWEDDEPTATEDSGDVSKATGEDVDRASAKEPKKRSD